jgi:hypothetical protein
MFSYEKIKNTLMNNRAKVTFTKADGTERVMICTLDESHIPVEYMPTGKAKHHNSHDTICVFDLENNGWRSFRVDSVHEICVRKSYWTNRTNKMVA